MNAIAWPISIAAAFLLAAYVRIRLIGHRRRVVRVKEPDGTTHYRIEMPIRLWEWQPVQGWERTLASRFTEEQVIAAAKRLSREAATGESEARIGTYDRDRLVEGDGPDPYNQPR